MSAVRLASVGELAALIREAGGRGTRVLAVGGGSHGGVDGDQGQQASLAGLHSVVAYDPADLVATVDAGLSVQELDATLAAHGQEWAADIVPGSTVGGAIASGASSLRRLAMGPLRDSVLGLELVDGRGRLIRVGGRTVKNSTGLDLVRLVVGSRGTLGIVTRAHLRVRPRPRARLVVRAPGVDVRSAVEASRHAGGLAAAMVDQVSARFLLEGWGQDVAADAAMLADRLGAQVEEGAAAISPGRPWEAWPAVALLTVRPSALELLAATAGQRWAALPMTGHLWVGGESVADLMALARAAVNSGGHATHVSERGWPTLRADAPSAADGIAERVKAAFDPDAVFPSLASWAAA